MCVMVVVSRVGGVWQWCSPVGSEVPYVYALNRHCVGPWGMPLEDNPRLLLLLLLLSLLSTRRGRSIINKQL